MSEQTTNSAVERTMGQKPESAFRAKIKGLALLSGFLERKEVHSAACHALIPDWYCVRRADYHSQCELAELPYVHPLPLFSLRLAPIRSLHFPL